MDEDPFVSDDGAAPGSARGKLLLAGPLLLDPNFFRAVVLVLDHDDEGAFGLVVNRRSEIPLADVLAAWAPFARPDAYVYLGGPVAPEAGFALARAGSPDLSGVSPSTSKPTRSWSGPNSRTYASFRAMRAGARVNSTPN